MSSPCKVHKVIVSSCQWNLIKNLLNGQKLTSKSGKILFSKSIFNVKNPSNLSKNFFLKNINLGATFLFLSILCSIKIERLLFVKFLKNLAFFDSYFWPLHLSRLMKKSLPFLWWVQSWLKSEMFLSNSVDMMKNLTRWHSFRCARNGLGSRQI